MVDLSVLICSTHTRWNTFGQAIQSQIWEQYALLPPGDQERVEILVLTDNKAMMLGHKRNVMVDIAQGRYVVFVDDDDRLEDEYLPALLEAVVTDCDVITFLVSVTQNGEDQRICRYSKDFRVDRNPNGSYERRPNHICCVKRELAAQASFPNVLRGEDAGYAGLLQPLLKTECAIDKVLYHYDFNTETTETQIYKRAALRRRKQAPIVDVIILSDANAPGMGAMTQEAIDTCVAGANSLPVNVIVMEQQAQSYKHATTVRCAGEFNYNQRANRGARLGSAPWIMVANNDLIFRDGWLHALLAAGHPFVSPKCPRDPRQEQFTENTVGDLTGRHLSGWCFMVRRELWEKIGGFDERVNFWCSDDVVIEQAKAHDVLPMLVVDSTVEHIQSATLRTKENHEDLMWRNIHVFNTIYGEHRLSRDRRFLRWKARNKIG